jgi:5-(carboxyamino)imidazole ribonucleotide synthase
MFVTPSGSVLVNEVAPRPHNSGHHTIEACTTSQFEQHLRAISGIPLGSTEQWASAASVNILGDGGGRGPAVVEGFARAAEIPETFIHIYGKSHTWAGRKMGHITALHRDIEEAARRAVEARRRLRIRPEAA